MSRLIVGLMSGTSVDGIDAALVRVDGKRGRYRAEVLQHAERRWPPALRQRLLQAMAPATITTQELCSLNVLVAQAFAEAALHCIRAAKLKPNQITAIGSHGQTICHLPPQSTLQIGSVSTIAALTGIKTVGDFRLADMAHGGQGAPLVPFADQCLLQHRTRIRAVQNIGGIANVTYLPPRGEGDVIAFDTGPGNMLIDAVVRHATGNPYDKNGKLAAAGKLNLPLISDLQAMPYFRQSPPKSTGRELFGEQLAAKLVERKIPLPDLLYTLTRFTAWSIIDAYARFLPVWPDEIILCGGGVYNKTLFGMITGAATARGSVVSTIDDFHIPNKSKEAASFAILAAATLDGIAGNVITVTGAARPCVLGVVANPTPQLG